MLWLCEVYFRLKHNKKIIIKKKGWTSTEMEQTGREEGRGSKICFSPPATRGQGNASNHSLPFKHTVANLEDKVYLKSTKQTKNKQTNKHVLLKDAKCVTKGLGI